LSPGRRGCAEPVPGEGGVCLDLLAKLRDPLVLQGQLGEPVEPGVLGRVGLWRRLGQLPPVKGKPLVLDEGGGVGEQAAAELTATTDHHGRRIAISHNEDPRHDPARERLVEPFEAFHKQ
jgi:hypothetical protein